MKDDPRTKPLKEWNRLARENTENAIVSSMFEASSKSSPIIDQFSTWLLVGTAAIASFFIVNSDKLVPLITKEGFLTCGSFLCLSCVSGLVSKIYSVRCKIGIEVGAAVRETFLTHLDSYSQEEEKIKDGANFWGITLETGIRMERILQEFFKPQTKFAIWLANRILKKNQGNPQVGYLPLIAMLNKQGLFAFIQSMLFLCFLISGFIYPAAI